MVNSDMGADLKLSAFSQLQLFGSPPLGKVPSGGAAGETFIDLRPQYLGNRSYLSLRERMVLRIMTERNPLRHRAITD